MFATCHIPTQVQPHEEEGRDPEAALSTTRCAQLAPTFRSCKLDATESRGPSWTVPSLSWQGKFWDLAERAHNGPPGKPPASLRE